MIRTLLIDDEKHSLESLKIEIESYCPELEILALCKGAKAGIEGIRAHDPDLIFLDIDMPGMDGFALLEAVRDISFDVIFATAYDEYAVRAIKVSAMDYLLKPIDPEELKKAVNKISNKRSREDPLLKLDVLLTNLKSENGGFQKMALPTLSGLDFVNVRDIIYCIADGSYTKICTVNGDVYLISRTMKETSELLENPIFFRTHQSYLINLNCIKKYIKGSGGQIVMEDGQTVLVSRARKKELMKILIKK